jgi:TPR repeat protein
MEGNPSSESVAGAGIWLERAAKQGNSSARLYLAALLAASPVKGLQDPKRALTLVDAAEKDFAHDPTVLEIKAAASAALGDYAAASKTELYAIEAARRFSWDLNPMKTR